MRWNVDLVLDTVSQLVPLVAALVAEELPVDCHATEVTVIFITPILTVVSANRGLLVSITRLESLLLRIDVFFNYFKSVEK